MASTSPGDLLLFVSQNTHLKIKLIEKIVFNFQIHVIVYEHVAGQVPGRERERERRK